MECSQVARHRFLVTTSGGSNPSTPNKYFLLHKFSIFIVLLTMRSLVSKIETRWINKKQELFSIKKVLLGLKSSMVLNKKDSPVQNILPLAQLSASTDRGFVYKKTITRRKGPGVLLTKRDRAGLSYKYKAFFLGVRWRGIHTTISLERRGFSYSDTVKERIAVLSPSLLNLEKLINLQNTDSKN